jgi:hypothetical protein
MAGNAIVIYKNLAIAIQSSSRARAKASELDKMAAQQWGLEMQRAGALMEIQDAKTKLNAEVIQYKGRKTSDVKLAEDNLADKIRKYDRLTKAINDSQKAQEEVIKSINISDFNYSSAEQKSKYEKTEAERKRKAEADKKKQEREGIQQATSTNKINEINQKQAIETSRAEVAMQISIVQERIDIMAEGGEKTLEQMKLNHKKELLEIQRQKEDLLIKEIDKERSKFEADPKNKGKVFDSSSIKLTDAQEKSFEIYTKSTMSRQGTELASLYKTLLSDYQTYADKRLAIKTKFESESRVLDKIGATDEQKKELAQNTEKSYEEVDKEFASKSKSFEAWMNAISSMSLNKLLATLKEAENALVMEQMKNHNSDGTIKDTNNVAILRAKISELTQRISVLQEENKNKSGRTVKDWKDTEEVLSKVNGELKNIGKNIGGAAGELIDFAGELSTNVISMIDSIVQLSEMNSKAVQVTATGAAKAIQTVEKASVILAIVSAALQVIEKIKSVLSTDASSQFELEYQQKRLELQLKYNQALVEQLALQNEMFGGDKYANALSYVKAYYQALNNYDDEYQNAVFVKQKKSSGGLLGKINPFYEYAANTFGDKHTYTVNARENMQIQTSKGNFWKHSKYQNLEEWIRQNIKNTDGSAAELFNTDGSLNLNIAKSVVEMDNLTDETKKYLQSLIDCQTTVNEMNESLKEYINDTFGDLGDSMTKVIVDAFKNGTDAAKTFKTDMITVLEDVGEQMVKSLFIQKYIDAYSTELQDIYKKQRTGTDEQKATAIADEVAQASAEYFSSLTDAQQKSDEWLKMYQELAKKYGFDLYNNTASQSAQTGTITTITEETGTEIKGTMLALQNRATSIDDGIKDQSTMLTNALAPLIKIEENTRHCERLEQIGDDIASIKRDGLSTKIKN